MRGKPSVSQLSVRTLRITPADAGKTRSQIVPRARGQDHPRGCGENSITRVLEVTRQGSPPRMRGKHVYHEDGTGIFRITPADAGKTPFRLKAIATLQDHPRGCGENLHGHASISTPDGITPADAGKTGRGCAEFRQSGDHPRGCGENLYR